MKTCVITLSHVDGLPSVRMDRDSYDEVIFADGGIKTGQYLGLQPDLLIGDYDSGRLPTPEELKASGVTTDPIILPTKKDMTDSEAAIDLAVSRGCTDITVIGGLGGRFDHTMGNLGMLAKYTSQLDGIRMIDGWNRIFMADPGTITVHKDGYKYLGIAAYGEEVTGITYTGMAYPLEDYTLDNRTTRGVSNEILGETGAITFRTGRLLIIQSNDAR